MTTRYSTALAAVLCSTAIAQDLPKEGRYDFTACWSGVSQVVTLPPKHTANSYEMTGSVRSNPPGGMFDKQSFRCVGTNASIDGKPSGITVCEAVDAAGDKRLTYFSLAADGTVVRQHVAGTGKYEGMVTSGSVAPLGPFPTVKPGLFQDCNHQTGTYRMR